MSEPCGKPSGKGDRDSAKHRRRQVHCTRRFARMQPHEDAGEAVIERVRMSGSERERAHAGLKRRAIAEIETGKERRVIADERDRRETRCD